MHAHTHTYAHTYIHSTHIIYTQTHSHKHTVTNTQTLNGFLNQVDKLIMKLTLRNFVNFRRGLQFGERVQNFEGMQKYLRAVHLLKKSAYVYPPMK